MKSLRIGLVGAGGIAQRNGREAKSSGVAEISGVHDVNNRAAKELARALNCNAVQSYEQLLEDPATDAVLLSVPHHLHRPMAIQAAESGKHILVEKPLANNLTEAQEIVRACHRSGVALSVNYSFRYLPRVRAARQLVEEGALGEISGVQVLVHQYKDRGYWAGGRSNSPDDWRASKERCGGGFLIMNLCHVIDYLSFITGLEAERAYAEYATLASPIEVEDVISVSYRLKNGAVGLIGGSSIMRGQEQEEQRVWGTRGSLSMEGDILSFYSTRPALGRRPGRLHRIKKFPKVSWTAEWVRDFHAAVREQRDPEIGLREAWANLAFIQAAYESLEAGRPIEPQPFPGAPLLMSEVV